MFTVKKITINGFGGIIGVTFCGRRCWQCDCRKQGFGILNSNFEIGGNGATGVISAGGYGVRQTDFNGGAVFQALNATGNGSDVPVSNFFEDVRQSESSVQFDPFFGITPTSLTDLDAFLGTSANTPSIIGVTDSGVLEDVTAVGTSSLNKLTAQTVRVSLPVFIPVTAPTTPTPNIPVQGQEFATEFNFANFIGQVNIRGNIDGMQITTGRINSFTQGGSVSRCGIAVAGAIKSLTIHGNFGQTITDPATGNPIPDSYISATGASGSIASSPFRASFPATSPPPRTSAG